MGHKTIWKYDLSILDEQTILISVGAEILSVACQREIPVLWAKVYPDGPQIYRKVQMRGTGHPLNGREGTFVGTAIMAGGALVWHVFVSPEK